MNKIRHNFSEYFYRKSLGSSSESSCVKLFLKNFTIGQGANFRIKMFLFWWHSKVLLMVYCSSVGCHHCLINSRLGCVGNLKQQAGIPGVPKQLQSQNTSAHHSVEPKSETIDLNLYVLALWHTRWLVRHLIVVWCEHITMSQWLSHSKDLGGCCPHQRGTRNLLSPKRYYKNTQYNGYAV